MGTEYSGTAKAHIGYTFCMAELPKAYNPSEHEKAIYQRWLDSGYFNPDKLPNTKKRKPFTISMPPTNATGILHIGHAAGFTLQDIMIRFQRMQKRRSLWLPGTDHAAIATQNVVEKELKKKGKTRHELGRKAFLERVDRFVKEHRGVITEQTQRLGASCDWSRERFTLDEGLSLAVRTAFVELYNDGLIYRGTKVVNWCPHCQSTLADDEVEYKEQPTLLYTFTYDANFPIPIATTRPETKFGDTAVAVHPSDERYKQYVGKEFAVLFAGLERKIKVVADHSVDKEFGTGALGVTPAHSATDEAIAQREHLPSLVVIDKNGRMTKEAGEHAGLKVKDTREKIVAWLREQGLLEREEKITHNLSICYRCGTPIEPMPLEQWFVAVDKPSKKLGGKSLKQRALNVLEKNEITFVPERFASVYKRWMENLHDWCISRQIWYGHPIPVWYCGNPEMKRMGFVKEVVGQVFNRKISTWRLRDHGFEVGDRVAFHDSTTKKVFGYGTITEVRVSRIADIDLRDKRHWKTYNNVHELVAAFQKHYPRKEVTPETTAWLYAYSFDKKVRPGECGTMVVSSNIPSKCPTCGSQSLKQDPDTLDTWFSSSLWTFSTLGWPEKTKDLATFHPTDVMETGYDIIFFWVARMIMMSTYHAHEIPFHTVYLHGLVRDKQGRKMSKSLGNGIDPLAMADKYGADAVRLSLVIGTTPGNDQKLYEEKIASFRNYANKLWNIGRFLQMQEPAPNRVAVESPFHGGAKMASLSDRWIASKLERLIEQTMNQLENFAFGQAGEALYDFAWHDFADWYLEIVKIEKNVPLAHQTFRTLLILLHPFMPFVTETLWKELGYGKDLLMVESWPEFDRQHIDENAEREFTKLQSEITELRKERKAVADLGSPVTELKRPSDNIVWQYREIVEGLVRVTLISA